MTIKEAEALSGVSSRNIRFYEKKGLLSPARNRENDYREYSEADIQQLKLIRALRMVDMPVEQIRRVCDGEVTLDMALAIHRKTLLGRKLQLETAIRFCDEYLKTPDQDLDELLLRMDAAKDEKQLFTDWYHDHLHNVMRNILLVLIGITPSIVGAILFQLVVFAVYFVPVFAYVIAAVCLFYWWCMGFMLTKRWGHPYKNALICHCPMLLSAVTVFAWESLSGFLPYYIQNIVLNLILVPQWVVLGPIVGSGDFLPVAPLINVAYDFVSFAQILLMAIVFYLGGMTAMIIQFRKRRLNSVTA